MKIGIVTQPLTTNYGGILQNYSLQTVLRRKGHNTFTFDLGRYNFGDWIFLLSKVIISKVLGRNVFFPLTLSKNRKKEVPLRKFVDEHIDLIKPRVTRPTQKITNEYNLDCLIVGSDQVWRPRYTSHLSDMFLSFCSRKDVVKLAYAASFGTDRWEFTKSDTDLCRKLAQDFKAISVRENTGVHLCNKYLSIEATQVLDPTLLLQSKDYIRLCNKISEKEPFIFAYILDTDNVKINEIKEFSKNEGIPVIIKNAGREIETSDSIELWLSYFRDAKYIITDSFHGTAFSINFNKDFLVYGNIERGNSRFTSLLKIFNLQDRLVSSIKSNMTHIDWNAVNVILSQERERSLSWLTNNIIN